MQINVVSKTLNVRGTYEKNIRAKKQLVGYVFIYMSLLARPVLSGYWPQKTKTPRSRMWAKLFFYVENFAHRRCFRHYAGHEDRMMTNQNLRKFGLSFSISSDTLDLKNVVSFFARVTVRNRFEFSCIAIRKVSRDYYYFLLLKIYNL